MIARTKKYSITAFIIVILSCYLFGSCIFSPDEGDNENSTPTGTIVEPYSAEDVMNNLKVAFSHLEPDWYEDCLHENYFYESPSHLDDLDLRYSRSQDMTIIRNMFEDSISFIFSTTLIGSFEEFGMNVEDIPTGAIVVEEHPDEIWYVYNYTVDMDIVFGTHGPQSVRQNMSIKMIVDPDTDHYSIIRWIDVTPE